MTPRGSRALGPWWRSRVAFVLLLLLALTGLMATLAWQAYSVSRSHRDNAMRVLDDYAALTAGEFGRRVAAYYDREIGYRVGPLLGGSRPASLAQLARAAGGAEAVAPRMVRSFLRFEIDGEHMSRSADLDETASVDHHVQDLLDWFVSESWRGGPIGVPHLYCVDSGEAGRPPRIYGLSLRPIDSDEKAQFIVGVEFDPAGISDLLQTVLAVGVTLPQPLGDRIEDVAAIGLRIRSPGGTELLQRGRMDYAAGKARHRLDSHLGGLLVETTIRQDVAETLLIGGLPQPRWPLLAAAMLLSLLFAALAVWLLLREYELGRLRSAFVDSVSHELRTPLAQIRLYAETLMLGRVRSEDEARSSLEVIDVEARRLDHLVANVLDFSRSGPRGHEGPTLNPAATVRAVVEGFRPLAASGKAELQCRVDEVPPLAISEESLRQVLLNLLDNAVKYGPSGQTVLVELRARSEDGAILAVEDEGDGVELADRKRIWQQYWRAPQMRSHTTGAGIGLSLVRQIVEGVGGSAGVVDAPNGGARFELFLPRAEIEGEVEAAWQGS